MSSPRDDAATRAVDDGYAAMIGLRFTGLGETRLTVRPDLVNPIGRLYGPVGFALADYAMGDVVWSALPAEKGAATLNVAINYLTSASSGEVICRARLDRLGRNTAFTSAEVHDENGRLLYTTVGTFGIFTLEQAQR